MGNGDGNLEEQIERVEEQIRRVEEQIRRVEEQIRRVEEKIERVEEQVAGCPDDEERKLLQGKEARLQDEKARLQDEKAQLRDEKAQLRDKEAQLLQGRDKCTEYDWLRQDLPLLDSGRCVKSPSTTHKERMHTPVRVEFWDVEGDIKGFLEKADRVKRRFQKVDNLTATIGMRNLHHVAGSVVASTCDFVRNKRSGSSVRYETEYNLPICSTEEGNLEDGNLENSGKSRSEDREVVKCLYYGKPPRADIFVRSDDKGVAVFELKNGGLGCPVRIHKLWAGCSCRTGSDFNCWCKSGITKGYARSLLNCVLQVYEYLVLAKVGYGVLTDIQNWYLFKRDHTGCLYVSSVFKWDDKKLPLPAAVAYLINTSVDTGGEFDGSPQKGERPWSWEATPSTSPSADSNYHPNESKIDSSEMPSTRTREAYSNRRQKQLQEIPAVDLHLDDRPIADEGWSGCVVGGRLNGHRVAVKFAPQKSERAEALLNEAFAYLKLQEHWGVFVPPLIGHGTTAHGQIVYIATELIDGSPLGPATVTEEVASAALQALGAVHACELLHGDVEARNIMVVRGRQPSVRLVDFGFARCCSNRSSQKAELRKLQRLLEEMMRVEVGKKSDGVRYPHKRLCLV